MVSHCNDESKHSPGLPNIVSIFSWVFSSRDPADFHLPWLNAATQWFVFSILKTTTQIMLDEFKQPLVNIAMEISFKQWANHQNRLFSIANSQFTGGYLHPHGQPFFFGSGVGGMTSLTIHSKLPNRRQRLENARQLSGFAALCAHLQWLGDVRGCWHGVPRWI